MDTSIGTSSELVDSDITCAQCDYNLRTLSREGKCPECGLSVVESIDKERREAIRYGPPLERQPARWLAVVGAAFLVYLVIGVLRDGVIFLINIPAAPSSVPGWYPVADGVALVVMLTAGWTMTRRADGEPVRSRWLRYACRAALSVYFGGMLYGLGLYLRYGTAAVDARHLGALVSALLFTGPLATAPFFAHAALLAARLRQTALRRVCWCLTAAAIGFFSLLEASQLFRWPLPIRPPFLVPPILGPFDEVVASIWRMGTGNWPDSLASWTLHAAWVLCAVSVLAIFGCVLLNLAAAQRRKTAASSRP